MCRLCAITVTNLPEVVNSDSCINQELLHEMMLRAYPEDGVQKDGWGVSDGTSIFKGAQGYAETVPKWMHGVNASPAYIGHVRKASTGTNRTTLEAHPYEFDVHGQKLITAHNGWIAGTSWKNWHGKDAPQTDSYRAFSDLAELLRNTEHTVITPAIINEWLSAYESNTQYAMLLMYGEHVYAVRGYRPLYALEVGNGYLVNTSETVLKTMRRYLEEMYDVQGLKDTVYVRDRSLVRITPGDVHVQLDPIDPTFITKHTYVSGWGSDNWSRDSGNARAAEVNPSANQSASANITVAAAVTKPRRKAPDNVTVIAPSADRTSQVDTIWQEISQGLTPMRSALARYWIADSLGYRLADGTPDAGFLRYVTVTDMVLLKEMLLPVDVETGSRLRPFTSLQNMMLNWWNHIVHQGCDIPAFQKLFGTDPFWLAFDAEKTYSLDEKEVCEVYDVWRAEVVKLLKEVIARDTEVVRYIDQRVLNAESEAVRLMLSAQG